MTISGDVLRVELDTYEDGELIENQKFILQRSNDSTDDLEVCASQKMALTRIKYEEPQGSFFMVFFKNPMA